VQKITDPDPGSQKPYGSAGSGTLGGTGTEPNTVTVQIFKQYLPLEDSTITLKYVFPIIIIRVITRKKKFVKTIDTGIS
jgi:hypothetical protein